MFRFEVLSAIFPPSLPPPRGSDEDAPVAASSLGARLSSCYESCAQFGPFVFVRLNCRGLKFNARILRRDSLFLYHGLTLCLDLVRL